MNYAQLTLDGFEAPSAKIVAIAKAEKNADPLWMRAAEYCIEQACLNRDEWTTDLIWEQLDHANVPAPREPRAMGAAIRKAAVSGLIEATGRYVQSTREVNHQRPIMVWRSLVR